MRVTLTAIVLAVACSAPNAAVSSPSASPAQGSPTSSAATSTETSALPSAAPSTTPAATPSATATMVLPSSAGAVADAGIVFFSDYGPSDGNQLGVRTLYRYEGATGSITSFGGGPMAVLSSTGISHESALGVYLRGMQGRWDLMHWNGTPATDQEFTACQVSPGYFASWCTVTPGGVGLGYGSHTANICGSSQFVRLPGAATSRPLPAELCVIGAWANDDGSMVIAGGFVAAGPVGAGCAAGLLELSGTCYRRETWVIPTTGGPPRVLRVPELPDFVGAFVVAPDGRQTVARHLGGLFLIDLASNRVTHLGTPTWDGAWSRDGRFVFVRGGGRETWGERTIVVATSGGPPREVRGYAGDWAPHGLAPVWEHAGGRLAWIAWPDPVGQNQDPAADYLAGRGVGDRRVLVGDLASSPTEFRCPEGVAEGVRWSHDGTALLLLCRRPGLRANAFELWLQPLTTGARPVPLVRGLTLGGVDPNGEAPSLLANVGWSRGWPIGR